MKRGRYEPHVLTVGERQETERYLSELRDRQDVVKTGAAHFRKHCELNALDPDSAVAFASFTISLRAGADPVQRRTLHGYLKESQTSLREDDRSEAEVLRGFMIDDASEAAAKAPRGHAPDYCLSMLTVLYKHLAPGHQVLGWLGLAAGLRNVDFQSLQLHNLALRYAKDGTLDELIITVEFGKTIRKTTERRTVCLPRVLLPKQQPPETLKRLSSKEGSSGWRMATVDEFNQEARLAARRADTIYRRGAPTTYSFRRNFVHRVISHCKGPIGVNWEQVTKYTLHFSDENVRANYELTAADYNDLGTNYNPWA